MRHVLTLDIHGRTRQALIHVPDQAGDSKSLLPVVALLHGMGGTASWALQETRWTHLADKEGFVVVAPEGHRPHPEQPAGFLKNPQVWNDGISQQMMGMQQTDDVAFFAAVLDELPSRFPVDPSRVCLTGFSNGAAMVFRLGVELTSRLAFLAPVAGHCWQEDPQVSPPLPTLYLVGMQDPLIPFAGGQVPTPWGPARHKPPVRQTLARWARALGCPEEPTSIHQEDGLTRQRYGSGHRGAQMSAYLIDGLGHHWPGGKGQLSRRMFGSPSERINASQVIWRTFQGLPGEMR